ncbi:variable surface protein [Plasmodium gonderi]|uniref:Variable surface protein n=1 Tax=Plasmodium gonderi TaxID=77519 RepID=A0A1Y1JLE0_PLAGO|nr:variable surface protein [Plasmodium gonderi]GAW82037.1 variable surface protein [Plasmodium gonderi]
MISGSSDDWNDLLTDLNSHEIYKELNKELSDTYKNISGHCDNIKIEKGDIKTLCKKIERNLGILDEIDKIKTESYRDRCLYFNFWVFDELHKVYNGSEKNVLKTSDIDELLLKWNKINYTLINKDFNKNYKSIVPEEPKGVIRLNGDEQPPETTNGWNARKVTKLFDNYEFRKYKPCFYYSLCTLDNCKDIKYLFDYFKEFENIKNKISSGNEKCASYYKYLTHIKKIYEKYKKEHNCCDVFWGNLCEDYFKCEKKYDPNNLLADFKSCDSPSSTKKEEVSDDKSTKNLGDQQSSRSQRSTVDNLENKTEYKFFRCKEMKNDILPTYAACSEVSAENYERFDEVFNLEPLIDPFKFYKSKGATRIGKDHTRNLYIHLNIHNITKNIDYFKIGVSFLLVLGTFFVSFIYYKFTPFGPWLNSKFLRGKRNRHYIYQDQRKLQNRSSSSVNNRSRNNRVRIAYQSS